MNQKGWKKFKQAMPGAKLVSMSGIHPAAAIKLSDKRYLLWSKDRMELALAFVLHASG
jgi:hypothetical protein